MSWIDDAPDVTITPPQPPEGWRRTPPTQAYGTGIMCHYLTELAELAQERGYAHTGATLQCDYRNVDGEWFPKPETLRVIAGEQ